MIFCLGATPTVQRSMFFDRLTVDAVNRAADVREYASGKSVNVARVAHTLGHAVVATGFLGGDRGAFLREALDGEGIPHDFVTVAARTRLCTTLVDRSAGTATELVEESATVEPGAWDNLWDRVIALGAAAAAGWVLSGSLPPGAPPDFYARCVAHAHRLGCRVVVVDARGEPLRQALAQPGFVAKLNREELAATVAAPLDNDGDLRRAMDDVRPRDGAIVVTLGSAGAVASDGRAAWRVTPPRVTAISAVGSGDAFAAGLAIALLDGRPLPDALVYGAACGAANAMTPLAGHVRPEDVRALEPRVTVERW